MCGSFVPWRAAQHCFKRLTTTHCSAGSQKLDYSQIWVKQLEGPLPQLPSSKADVEAVLFPAQPDIKLLSPQCTTTQ